MTHVFPLIWIDYIDAVGDVFFYAAGQTERGTSSSVYIAGVGVRLNSFIGYCWGKALDRRNVLEQLHVREVRYWNR